MMSTSDEQLLMTWRGGERKAGAALFERHHASLARFFMRKVGREDSDELVQRSFLGLLEGLERFRGDASVRTLLFAIARNQYYYYLRTRARDRERFDPSHTSLAALEPTPTQELAAEQQQQLLLRALRELPLDLQLMFELRYWEDMPPLEIAKVLDKPAATVRVQLHRGRAKLEAHMTRLATSKAELEQSLGGLSTWAAGLRGGLDGVNDSS